MLEYIHNSHVLNTYKEKNNYWRKKFSSDGNIKM